MTYRDFTKASYEEYHAIGETIEGEIEAGGWRNGWDFLDDGVYNLIGISIGTAFDSEYERVLDINNYTRECVDRIFNNVYQTDANYATQVKNQTDAMDKMSARSQSLADALELMSRQPAKIIAGSFFDSMGLETYFGMDDSNPSDWAFTKLRKKLDLLAEQGISATVSDDDLLGLYEKLWESGLNPNDAIESAMSASDPYPELFVKYFTQYDSTWLEKAVALWAGKEHYTLWDKWFQMNGQHKIDPNNFNTALAYQIYECIQSGNEPFYYNGKSLDDVVGESTGGAFSAIRFWTLFYTLKAAGRSTQILEDNYPEACEAMEQFAEYANGSTIV